MKTAVIADDHDVIRFAVKKLLKDFNVVGEAGDGDSAVELVARKKPDLLLLDLTMPKRTGISIISAIRENNADIKILIITIHASIERARRALHAGADGYFVKDEGVAALRSAIAHVMDGRRYLSPSLYE